MKKIGIITLSGNYNYGNRLQNYAMQEVYKKLAIILVFVLISLFQFSFVINLTSSFLNSLTFSCAKSWLGVLLGPLFNPNALVNGYESYEDII